MYINLVISLLGTWVCVYAEDRERKAELVREISGAKRTLEESLTELAVMEEGDRAVLYPGSCKNIRNICTGPLRTGMYSVYDVKETTRVSAGFVMNAGQMHCEFDFDGPDVGPPACALPQYAEQRNLLLPTDCMDIRMSYDNMAPDGIYKLYNRKWTKKTKKGIKMLPKRVKCDMRTAGSGWTVIQQRVDGDVDFFEGWEKYALGFGDWRGDHWLGNRALHDLTHQKDYVLRVQLELDGEEQTAVYQNFQVDSEDNNFRLTLDVKGEFGYMGTADDLLYYYSGMEFSTWDADNDYATHNCAKAYKCGWWFKSCARTNLNGPIHVSGETDYQTMWWGKIEKVLKKVVMMIRPRFVE